jgi:AcrR family transcriptional regulator
MPTKRSAHSTRRASEPRKRRSTQENMDLIMRAAAAEFRASGFGGATTAAIARSAGVTEAQIFRYFDSKSKLFRESLFKPLNQHFLKFNAEHAKGNVAKTRSHRARQYIGELQQFLAAHAKTLMSLIVAQTYEAASAGGVQEIDSLNSYFERGASMMTQRTGAMPTVDPKLMVRVSFAAVLACALFKDWLFPRGIASDEEISAAVREFVMDGVNANSETQ